MKKTLVLLTALVTVLYFSNCTKESKTIEPNYQLTESLKKFEQNFPAAYAKLNFSQS